jgi:predicted outer membrane protein
MTSASARSVAVIAAVLAVACAAVDDKTAAEPKATREYRTGSNIPVKAAPPATDEERARAADQLRDAQRMTPTAKP